MQASKLARQRVEEAQIWPFAEQVMDLGRIIEPGESKLFKSFECGVLVFVNLHVLFVL
jgi:hypothetical protein